MASKKRFMEAVVEKVSGKRKPMLKRKGGPTVVIAIGAPKPPMQDRKMAEENGNEGEPMSGPSMKPEHAKMSKAEHIAYLQEKIASLKAELAMLEDSEDDSESDSESEDSGESEDESEYED